MKKTTLILAAMALVSSQAYAGDNKGHPEKKHQCRSKDLNGDYVMYQAAVNNPVMNHTGRCEINVNDGDVTGSCAFDPNSTGNPNFHGPVYGTATMNSNCSADMTISFDVPNGPHIDSFFDVQFTPSKDAFIGKFDNTFGIYGVTNGARF
jgi:hypothetical protein